MGYWKGIFERLGGGNAAAYDGDYVCADCFDDPGLKSVVESEATAEFCSFCGRASNEPIAAPLVEVLLHMSDSLSREYDTAENRLGHDGSEGGYFGTTWTTPDLLEDLELPNDDDGSLRDALCDGLGDRIWCRQYPYSLGPDERLNFSWDEFSSLVKYRRRYFFLREKPRKDDEILSPLAMLQELSKSCERLGLIKTFPAGMALFRARYQKPGELLATAAELGPPPRELAKLPNRMSPAGVVMLYLSDSPDTALREVADAAGTFAIAEFKPLREMRILDLFDVPGVPSIYESVPDSLEYEPRPLLIFLSYFAADLAKPIVRDDRVHVEYVPTQIVTEYFRSEYRFEGAPIDGIRYRSSRHKGRWSTVLFAEREDVIEASQPKGGWAASRDPWIKLVKPLPQHTVTQVELDTWAREAPKETIWI